MADEFSFEDSRTAFADEASRKRAQQRRRDTAAASTWNPPPPVPGVTRRMQTTPKRRSPYAVESGVLDPSWLETREPSWSAEEQAAARWTRRMAVQHHGQRPAEPPVPRAGEMSFDLDGNVSFRADEYAAQYLNSGTTQRISDLVHTAALEVGAAGLQPGIAVYRERERLQDGTVLLQQVCDGLHLEVWSHGKPLYTRRTDALRSPEIFMRVMQCDESVADYVFAALGRMQQAMARAIVQCVRVGVLPTACQLRGVARDTLITTPTPIPVGVKWEF